MTPNDPKLSDGGGWRDGCAGEGGGAASVTAGAVRCSAWLGAVVIWVLEPVFQGIGHFKFGWHVWRTMKTPLDGLLKSELPNAALGNSAVARIRAVHE